MANTVTSLSYANTFGEQMAVTNLLVNENNILASDDYTKDSGTIYLSESTKTSLQSNGNIIVGKQLLVQGVGSSATIQNNLDVQGQGYFTNTTLSLSTTGTANIGNILNVLGSGSALRVTNNSIFFGNTSTVFNTFTSVLQANNTVNTSNASIVGTTYTKTLNANNNVLTASLQANNDVLTDALQANSSVLTTSLQANNNILTGVVQANTSTNTRTSSVTGISFTDTLQANTSTNTRTSSVTGISFTDTLQANSSTNTANASIMWTAYANVVQANATVNTTTLSVTDRGLVDVLQANSVVNTRTSSVTGISFTDVLQANSVMNTATLSVTGRGLVNVLQANSVVNTTTLSVTGAGTVDVLQANTRMNTDVLYVVSNGTINTLEANVYMNTPSLSVTQTISADMLQANTSTNTRTSSVTGTSFVNVSQANTTVNTTSLSVTGTGFVNVLQANSVVNTVTISATGRGIVDVLQANTRVNTANVTISEMLYAPNAEGYLRTLQTSGQVTVGGAFVINGATVYNSNVFTISAATTTPITSEFTVNRGAPATNASIRWNEPQKYFDVANVTSGNFFRILTDEHLSSSLTSGSATLVATASAACTLNNLITTANNFLQGGITAAGLYANTAYARQNTTAIYANSAFVQANAAFVVANNVGPQIQPAFNQANAAFISANNATNTIRGTVGQINPTTGVISFTSNNGVTIVATTANNLAVSTSQDLRTTASPAFNSLTLTNPLALAQGGTGSTSAAGALNALLPSGQVSGYVLTTGGPGNYYWAAGSGGGGGGAVPGTTINSTRLSYTGDGTTTKYTTPTFNNNTQLRAYINGVRQFESEYFPIIANSTVIFTSAPVAGDKVLIEVDGYILNPYYANNISYTVNPTISGTANTIQLAIDALAAGVAFKSGTTFTGQALGLTVATSASNTSFATTAFVKNVLNDSSSTYAISTSGNAGTVTNGLYSTGSYSDPTWIASLAASKLTGTVPSAVLGNSNLFVGTTSIALNRGTGSQTLTGVSIDGNAATAGGLAVETGRNNNANRIVRTDGSGYLQVGYINSSSGNEKNAASPSYVWGSNSSDDYLRSYQTSYLSVAYAASAGSAGSATTATTASTANALNSSNGYSIAGLNNNGWYQYNDNDRNAGNTTYYPNASTRSVRFFFANAGTTGTGGNYAGVMQFNPWDGTTSSTGDASYQLAFGSTAANNGGIPQLNIRKGIDSTWNSWHTLLHSGNYNSYSPTLTGGGASGNWSINAATATNSSYSYNYTRSFNSNWNTDFSEAPAGSMILRGDTSSGSSTGGPGNTWWFQQNYRHNNSTNLWGVQVAWGWEDNANTLKTRNVQNGNFGSWVTYLNSSNYTSYFTPFTVSYNNDSNANYQVLWGSGNQAYGTAGIYVNPATDSLYCNGEISAYASDGRLKTNVQKITNALDKVDNINGVTYEWDEKVSSLGFNPKKKNDVGVIAQQIEAVLPEAVDIAPFDLNEDGGSKSGENYLTVKYEKIVPLLIEAIKELKAEVEELKGRLNDN